jgi:hypothetical protein
LYRELEGTQKKYSLISLEDRVQFLIDLLEKCKTQLGYISDSESDASKSKKNINNEIDKKYGKQSVSSDTI